jgi:hypothetical protein
MGGIWVLGVVLVISWPPEPIDIGTALFVVPMGAYLGWLVSH